jgi:hypothetical protein
MLSGYGDQYAQETIGDPCGKPMTGANRQAIFSSLCAGIVAVLIFSVAGAATAQTASPTPAPIASPQATPPAAAAAPAIPKDFDPCGGPLELSNKLGNSTACVFVRGEAALTAQYGNANIPANAQLNAMGRTLNLSTSANAFGYPASVLYVGVLPRAEIAITPPSFVQVNSGRLGTLAAGASDMTFQYKQLLYVNLPKFTMVALDLAYKAPTGSPALRGPGPEYTIDPILTQPLPHNYGVTLALPVNNSATSCLTCSTTQRGWNLSTQLVPYWESPGGTLLALFVQHNFNPSVTPVAFSAGQLIGRHFDLALTVGGFTYSTTSVGAFQGLVSSSSTANPSLFTVSVNYLFGRSDLPAALTQ